MRIPRVAFSVVLLTSCMVGEAERDDPEGAVLAAAPSTLSWDGTAWVADPNGVGYHYAQSAMYDEATGTYKLWSCASDGTPGDRIHFKEARSIGELGAAPWSDALVSGLNEHPGIGTDAFDYNDTCDPSVINYGGVFYLYYGGDRGFDTRIGVAVSYDRGHTFSRLNNGRPIVDFVPCSPGAYCVGQPAVTQQPDGWLYMVYTRLTGTQENLRVVRSRSPLFTDVELVRDIDAYSWTVDSGFNITRQQWYVVHNMTTQDDGFIRVRVVWYDKTWTKVGVEDLVQHAGGTFGEGVALFTTSTKMASSSDVYWPYLVGTTWGKRTGLPDWIVGPLYTIRITGL